jgi:hypothetical protein
LKPDRDFQNAIAIMIAIKNRIQIDRDPIFVHKLIPGFSFSTGSQSLKKMLSGIAHKREVKPEP